MSTRSNTRLSLAIWGSIRILEFVDDPMRRIYQDLPSTHETMSHVNKIRSRASDKATHAVDSMDDSLTWHVINNANVAKRVLRDERKLPVSVTVVQACSGSNDGILGMVDELLATHLQDARSSPDFCVLKRSSSLWNFIQSKA